MRYKIFVLAGLASVLWAQPILQPGRTFQGTFNPRQTTDYEGIKVNWHVLNLARGQNFVVRAESENDSKLIAILPDGKVLENDDTFGLNPALFLSNLNGQVRIGFAFLDSSLRGNYVVFVEPIPPAINFTGGTARGNLDRRSAKIANFPVQVYTLNVPANQRLILTVDSEFDNKLIVVDPAGNTLTDDDSAGNGNARVILEPGAGGRATVIVHAYSPENEGEFSLRAMTPPPPISISLGRPFRGKITGNEAALGYYTDIYSSGMVSGVEFVFTAQEGKYYNVYLDSSEFDTFLEIKNGEEVLINDDVEGGTNSKISFTANRSGPVYVFARPFESGNTGTFSLSVQEPRLLQRYQGELSRTSPKDISGKYYVMQDFRGTPGKMLTIRFNSADFDALLFLQDSSGERIAENDDGNDGSNNSLVNVQVPADGKIRIIGTNYGSEVLTGRYEILIFED